MKKNFMTYNLLSGQSVSGMVCHIAQLSAKFQIWARQHGLTDEQSLACWIANQPEKHEIYFGDANVLDIAKNGF